MNGSNLNPIHTSKSGEIVIYLVMLYPQALTDELRNSVNFLWIPLKAPSVALRASSDCIIIGWHGAPSLVYWIDTEPSVSCSLSMLVVISGSRSRSRVSSWDVICSLSNLAASMWWSTRRTYIVDSDISWPLEKIMMLLGWRLLFHSTVVHMPPSVHHAYFHLVEYWNCVPHPCSGCHWLHASRGGFWESPSPPLSPRYRISLPIPCIPANIPISGSKIPVRTNAHLQGIIESRQLFLNHRERSLGVDI